MENPVVPCKRKHIQNITDYCLDNKIELTIRPGRANDEFEAEFSIDDITRAVALGMFLRENRLVLKGMEPQNNTRSRKSDREKPAATNGESEEKVLDTQDHGLQFDLNAEN